MDKTLSEAALGFLIVEVRDMDETPGLLDQRLGDLWVGVPQGADRDAASKVQIALAGYVPDVASSTMAERQIEAPVARDDKLVEKRPHLSVPILHDRRRFRNNVSHRYVTIHGISDIERDQNFAADAC